MITVVGIWEPGYSLEQLFIEDTIWKQTLSAYGVDRFVMVAGETFVPRVSVPEQFSTMQEALDSTKGRKVFLTFSDKDAMEMRTFQHPQDAVYIFGCQSDDLLSHINANDLQVHIDTPNNVDMLACSCVAAVLYARSLQA